MDRNDGKRSRAAEDCAVWSSVRARGAGWDGPPFLPSLIAPEEAVPPVWPLQPHTWPQCTVTCSPAITHLPALLTRLKILESREEEPSLLENWWREL